MTRRLESLDWLRGLMALSIMLFHFSGQEDVATLLGKLGIYGVSIFFILSGLSMAIAYDHYIKNINTSVTFLIRRVFRIWPLLWLAVVLMAVPQYFLGRSYGVLRIALNLSTLFGFVAPTQYINEGAWSIGNEMVYYAFTPALIALFRYRKWAGNIVTFATFGVSVWFAVAALDPSATLASQWPTYINPFNNLCLYCAGLAIYYNCRDIEVPSRWRVWLLVAPIAAFVFYPSSGDAIHIVTGVGRICMSLISIAIVLAFYKCPPFLGNFVGSRLEQLGVATYGVYLLHTIVMGYMKRIAPLFGVHNYRVLMLLAIPMTLVISILVYRWFESPFIGLGKKISKRFTSGDIATVKRCALVES